MIVIIQFCAIAFASPLLNVREMDVNVTDPPKDSYFTVSCKLEDERVKTLAILSSRAHPKHSQSKDETNEASENIWWLVCAH